MNNSKFQIKEVFFVAEFYIKTGQFIGALPGLFDDYVLAKAHI